MCESDLRFIDGTPEYDYWMGLKDSNGNWKEEKGEIKCQEQNSIRK